MNRRLGLVLATSLALTACAGGDPLVPLNADDALDDASCIEGGATYEEWLDGYLDGLRDIGFPLTAEGMEQARALAAERPCASDNDSFKAYWKLYGSALDRTTDRWFPFMQQYRSELHDNTAELTYDEYLAKLEITELDRGLMEAIRLAAPETNTGLAYVLWFKEYLQTHKFFSFAIYQIQATSIINRFEEKGFFSTPEQMWMDELLAARPEVIDGQAFAVWYQELMKLIVEAETTGFGEIEDDVISSMVRLIEIRPQAADDETGALWMESYRERLTKAYGYDGDISAKEDQVLSLIESSSPGVAGGDKMFRSWMILFAQRLDSGDGEVDDELAALLDRILEVKPCALGERPYEMHEALVEREASRSARAQEYAALAAPQGCE